MTVSNALPIQFWPQDEQTYNEKQVCGISEFCWCQMIQLDDTVTLYIDDDEPTQKTVAFFNEDDEIIYNTSFDSNGYASFVPEEQTLTEGVYKAVIYDNTDPLLITVKEPTEWTDEVGTITKNDGDNTLSTGAIGFVTRRVRMPAAVPDGTTFNFTYLVTISGTWTGTVEMGPFITDAAGLSKGTAPSTLLFTGNVANEFHNASFTPTSDGFSSDPMAFLKFTIFGPDTSGTATITITIFPGQLLYLDPDEVGLYKSDCLDIREEHECTGLITYSNHKDFAGIVYEGISPTPEFQIRVPMVFFHESYPQEEEVHPLSDDTWLRLSSRMERKKLLDLGYMPYYMHKKIQLILMHDNIEIDGEQWKKRDSYNIEEGDKRYPKPKANVLLTDKNFIKRNVI